MRAAYRQAMQTKSVEEQQLAAYGRVNKLPESGVSQDALTQQEIDFIADRDSFYLATVNEEGWPYIQHRGGPKGFLRAVEGRRLVFADYEGNRQLLSAGNIASNQKVSLFLMDYVARERLKLIGVAQIFRGDAMKQFESVLGDELTRATRVVQIEVVGFDWNCPKWITPCFTREQVEEVVAPLQERIENLDAELSKRV